MKYLLSLIVFLSPLANAGTFYVNPRGGTLAQCDGTTNAPYGGILPSSEAHPSSSTHCAWIHPFVALPPINSEHHIPPRIHSGDTLIIAQGSYKMGYDTSIPETAACYATATADCKMQPVPPGIDSQHKTKILGQGWNSGCKNPPILWGAKGEYAVVDLTGSSNTDVECLEITDHSSCIINHCSVQGATCIPAQTDMCVAGDDFANNGIIASDASGLSLANINIHGVYEGVRSGRLTNFSATNLRLWANSFAGWDGDIRNGQSGVDTSNYGQIYFNNLVVGWSGCSERWPSSTIYGCWDQNDGGYGDGLGTGPTQGHWVFINSKFQNNVSDGLDLLYHSNLDDIYIENFISEGNAGNQLKVSGPVVVKNALLIGTCAEPWSSFPPNNYTGSYTPSQFVGKYNMDIGGVCRANGDVLAIHSTPNSMASVIGSTLVGQSSGLVLNTGSDASGSSTRIINSILSNPGQIDWQMFATGGGSRGIYGFYDYEPENPNSTNLFVDRSIFWGLKNNQCPSGCMNVDPLLMNNNVLKFDWRLKNNSPAKNSADSKYCTTPTRKCSIGYKGG